MQKYSCFLPLHVRSGSKCTRAIELLFLDARQLEPKEEEPPEITETEKEAEEKLPDEEEIKLPVSLPKKDFDIQCLWKLHENK